MKEEVLYIVFCLNHKSKYHDGKVFRDYGDAKKFLQEEFNDFPDWNLKGVIGSFLTNNSGEMDIEFIESFGFKGDKAYVGQMDLFKSSN